MTMAFCMSFLSRISRLKTFESDIMETSLKRCLNSFDLTLLGVGGMVGAGLYILTGTVAKEIAGPAVFISFIIAGFASLLAALCYAEFGARIPKAGSAYVYTYVTIGEMWAFLIGWNIILEHLIASASVARAWSGYFDGLLNNRIRNFTYTHVTGGPFHIQFLAPYPDFLAAGLVFVATACIALGAKFSARLNTVLALFNLTVVAVVLCVGFYLADIRNWESDGGFTPFGVSGIISGAATCFYAYVGFDIIATSGEEVKDPARSIPIALIVSMTVVSLSYIGVSMTLTLMVPYYAIKPESAFPDAFLKHHIPWAQYIVGVGALLAMTAALLSHLFAIPRSIYAMANDGLLFSFLAKVNSITQVPVFATFISGIFTGVLAAIFDLHALVEFLSIGTLVAYTIVAASVIVQRYQPHFMRICTSPDGDCDQSDLSDPFQNEQNQQDDQNCGNSATENVDSRDFGKLKKRFKNLRFLASVAPGSLTTFATLMMGIFMLAFAALITHESHAVSSGEPWVILLVILFALMVVTWFTLICMHNQNTTASTFKVPFVPFVPALSMFCNSVLIMNLSYRTWIRFAIWITIGMVIYFTYGIRESKEERRWAAEHNPELQQFFVSRDVRYTTEATRELQRPHNPPNRHGDGIRSEKNDANSILLSEYRNDVTEAGALRTCTNLND
ncbi:cationic amino acid transporter 4-like [Ptychodera flava]|uniref:cationic amino acid transporter 4-like n=1 Tax=Ptychodera flava TaxID=63121 RepID=UPI00396A6FB9